MLYGTVDYYLGELLRQSKFLPTGFTSCGGTINRTEDVVEKAYLFEFKLTFTVVIKANILN